MSISPILIIHLRKDEIESIFIAQAVIGHEHPLEKEVVVASNTVHISYVMSHFH